MHRDVKPNNIMLHEDQTTIVLIDFGLCRKQSNANEGLSCSRPMTGTTGSFRFMAPEVLRKEQYDVKIDVYSGAMVVWSMLSGEVPFKNLPGQTVSMLADRQSLRPPIASIKNQTLARLIERAWDQDPCLRPEAREVEAEMQMLLNPDSTARLNPIRRVLRSITGFLKPESSPGNSPGSKTSPEVNVSCDSPEGLERQRLGGLKRRISLNGSLGRATQYLEITPLDPSGDTSKASEGSAMQQVERVMQDVDASGSERTASPNPFSIVPFRKFSRISSSGSSKPSSSSSCHTPASGSRAVRDVGSRAEKGI